MRKLYHIYRLFSDVLAGTLIVSSMAVLLAGMSSHPIIIEAGSLGDRPQPKLPSQGEGISQVIGAGPLDDIPQPTPTRISIVRPDLASSSMTNTEPVWTERLIPKPIENPIAEPATQPMPNILPTPLPEQSLGARAIPLSPPAANWGTPLYYFPYPAGPVKITRGGAGHHNGFGPAYDFTAGVGAPVLAARAGVVVRAEYDQYDPDCTTEATANQVVIDHGDGSYGVYLHFAYSQPLLKVGDTVTVGDTLGYTGCTGQANGPHVHFHVSNYFNPDNPDDIGYLVYRRNIWFFEAGQDEQVPPLDVYAAAAQFIDSQNPVADARPPAGQLLTPLDGAVVSDTLQIKGWAVDDTAVARIEIWLDDDYLGLADDQVKVSSPEVSCDDCGYEAEFNVSAYPPGAHVLALKFYDSASNVSQENWYILLERGDGLLPLSPQQEVGNLPVGPALVTQ